MSQEALQAAFSFTAADLTDNRSGRLSSAQQSHVEVQAGRGRTMNLVMGGVFVIFVVVIVAVVVPKMDSSSDSDSSSSSAVPPWVIAVVVVVVALLVLRTLLKTRRGMTRMASGAVHAVEGPAKTKARSFADANQVSNAVAIFRLTVGSVTFPLSSQRQLDAFDDGATYRCYYVKGTLPVLISAERV